jgi:hypothetical protein
MGFEIPVDREVLTAYERSHAENIYQACVAEMIRGAQHLSETELRQYIVERFIDTWEDLFGRGLEHVDDALLATKKSYAAFNYANQTLGALGGVRPLVAGFNIDPPPNAFMDRLEKALDQKIVLLRLQPMSLPAKETAFTM